MDNLTDIAKSLKGSRCERLVKQIGNEITISGTSFGILNYKFDIGDYSNHFQEFYKVPPVMIASDNLQYLLCRTIYEMKGDEALREVRVDCSKIRVLLILAFSNLQMMLIIPEPNEELKKKIVDWADYMCSLNKQCIRILTPASKEEEEIRLTENAFITSTELPYIVPDRLSEGEKATLAQMMDDSRIEEKLRKFQGIENHQVQNALDIMHAE
jgi:hypothetical protein